MLTAHNDEMFHLLREVSPNEQNWNMFEELSVAPETSYNSFRGVEPCEMDPSSNSTPHRIHSSVNGDDTHTC